MKKTVVAFGEILWDLLPDKTLLGGASFNFAYRIHSLGDRGVFVSRLGKDENGDKAFSAVESLGLETTFIQRDDAHPTGTVNVFFDEEKNPDYFIVPDVAYDFVEMSDALADTLQNADCFCFGTLAQRAETSRKAARMMIESATGAFKFLDINFRKDCYTPETVRASLQAADALKLNDEEVVELAGMVGVAYENVKSAALEIARKCRLKCCLVTLGPKGAFVCSGQGESCYVPGYKVQLADPLGAGDAFSAGFIHSYLREGDLQKAAELGNCVGAIVATQHGATQPLNKADIDRFMEKEPERVVHEEFANRQDTPE